MSAGRAPRFDPRAILASLERSGATYMIIGGLARVLRGADEITTGVDICPIVTAPNLTRLARALDELGARRAGGGDFVVTEQALSNENVLELTTPFGELKIVTAPAGVPVGFVALRAAATKENLGHGIQPYVASASDLAAMARRAPPRRGRRPAPGAAAHHGARGRPRAASSPRPLLNPLPPKLLASQTDARRASLADRLQSLDLAISRQPVPTSRRPRNSTTTDQTHHVHH